MAKLLKLRRGTTTQHGSFTGAEGEVTIDTTKDTAVVHDGSTAGGTPLAKENMDNVSSANIAARIGANAIDGSKISDGTITNAEVNASAAIAGTKINPYFGSQDISTTGHIDFPDDSSIKLGDSDEFVIKHTAAGVSEISSSADVTVSSNLNCSAGIDVTGTSNLTGTTNITGGVLNLGAADTASGHLNSYEVMTFNIDSDNDDSNRAFKWYKDGASGSGTQLLALDENGTLTASGNVDCNSGLDVTGNITCTGTVDGVDVAALYNATSGLSTGSGILNSGVTIANGVVATTQSAGDNSTKVATTAYADTAIANLVDSSPGALNTLNELAAAIGDDANFSTTVTNSIATKLPLAGGQMTGNITFSGSQTVDGRDLSADGAKLDGIDSGAKDDQTKAEIDALNINADQVDGLHASSFLRSDADDTATGDITFSGGAGAITLSNNSDIRSSYGTWTGEAPKIQWHSNNMYCCFTTLFNVRNQSGTNVASIDSSGNLTASGNVTAYSDQRLKTDIHTINDALGICGKLRGVSYKWLENDKAGIGVIAQEIEQVLPEVVLNNVQTDPATGETTEVKSVDYGKIVGVLINAINELKAEVDELKGGK